MVTGQSRASREQRDAVRSAQQRFEAANKRERDSNFSTLASGISAARASSAASARTAR
jgi:hypothetical protein